MPSQGPPTTDEPDRHEDGTAATAAEIDGLESAAAMQRNLSREITDETPIEIDGIEKRFGSIDALRGVELEIRPGEFHGIIGPNGSGKTTLFRIIAGLATPSSGTVSRPTSIGFSFQQPRFYQSLTVRENLSVFRSLAETPISKQWVETLIDKLRLDPVAHRSAGTLSGGFAKKLDLSLALLAQPTYVLLDEPLADIDDFSKRRILSFLAAYQQTGRTVVVSTHRIDEFATLLDRVTIILDGTVLEDGPARPPGEIRSHYMDRITAADTSR